MNDPTRAFALETAACLWEAVLGLRDNQRPDPGVVARARLIRQSFETIGTAALRVIVVGWTEAVDAAWSRVEAHYDMSFDWDFVPDWITSHVDWSDADCPIIRPDGDPDPDPPHTAVRDGFLTNDPTTESASMPVPTFNHVVALAFSVRSNDPQGEDFTPAMLKEALLTRIRDLDNSIAGGEWLEAIGVPLDTCEEEASDAE